MEHAALERCLEELHPDSFGWALACCRRDQDDAEEVLQIAYLKVIEGKARFDGRSSFKTWLFSVIRRTALERFRWKRTRQRLLSMFRFEPAAETAVDDRIERSETAQQLLRALNVLPSRQREVLELVFYHDLTIEQSAHALGISLGSARVHYDRGKKRMLRLLSEEGRVVFA